MPFGRWSHGFGLCRTGSFAAAKDPDGTAAACSVIRHQVLREKCRANDERRHRAETARSRDIAYKRQRPSRRRWAASIDDETAEHCTRSCVRE
jgi:hypothetical protein